MSGQEITHRVDAVQKTSLVLGKKFQQRQKREKTTFTPSLEEEEKNQADKSAGPIARLNLIIQTHAISSSSVSYAARLMFNHFRNVYFTKRN